MQTKPPRLGPSFSNMMGSCPDTYNYLRIWLTATRSQVDRDGHLSRRPPPRRAAARHRSVPAPRIGPPSTRLLSFRPQPHVAAPYSFQYAVRIPRSFYLSVVTLCLFSIWPMNKTVNSTTCAKNARLFFTSKFRYNLNCILKWTHRAYGWYCSYFTFFKTRWHRMLYRLPWS